MPHPSTAPRGPRQVMRSSPRWMRHAPRPGSAGRRSLGDAVAHSVWNQPSVRIGDVLDGVDRREILGGSVSGQRILLADAAGDQSWTIEKESSMGTSEQYLRNHNVQVAVQPTD